jgi:shikimate dehydrogenase
MRKSVGLIGYPLGHSISPAFQKPAFAAHGMEVDYELWEVEASGLPDLLKDLAASPAKLGANVTVPHKEAVIPLLDEVDEMASKIGAVNTIVKTSGGLKGYNTDAPGFLRSLQDEGGFAPQGKTAVIIGAGGVSRAVSFMLVQAGVESLHVFDIDQAKAKGLVDELGFSRAMTLKSDQDPEYEQAIRWADLLINCTPLGMLHSPLQDVSPVPQELIRFGSMVVDVVYNPPITPFMKLAKQAGAKTLGGLPMLVYQGAASFELWTGRDAPTGLMMQKALGALPS